MKLRTKLIAGFVLFMLIISGLGWVSYDRMSSLQQDLDQIYTDSFRKVELAFLIRDDMDNIASVLVTDMLNPNVNGEELLQKGKVYRDDIVKSFRELTAQYSTAQEKKLIELAIRDWDKYDEFVNKSVELTTKNKYEEANALRNKEGLEYQRNLKNSVADLANHHEMSIDNQVLEAKKHYEQSITLTAGIMVLGLVVSCAIMLWVIPSVTRNLNTMSIMMRSLARGRLRIVRKLEPHTNDEIGEVIQVFKRMAEDLEARKKNEELYRKAQEEQAWIDGNAARVTELLNGAATLNQVGQMFISEFVPTLGGQYGALYIRNETDQPDVFELFGTYAATDDLKAERTMVVGKGLLGQCVVDEKPIIISDMKDCSIRIESGVCQSQPIELILFPIMFERRVIAVLEMASLTKMSPVQHRLLEKLAQKLGVIVHTISGRLRVEELLRESQALTEELQCQSEELMTQQEELKRSNEHLESHTEALKRSEEMLQRQQEELEHYNTELIAKTRALEEQMLATQEKNEELEGARTILERQTLQLALASKYKSEFLANMSHELRTPLNSLLVLSQLLAENKEGNLGQKQVEYARTINMSGSDLLKMIDEILDLSKIDAGKMQLNFETVYLSELASFMSDSFETIAEQKGLEFKVEIDPDLPSSLVTDGHRVKQVVRNLIGNAFKFTTKGSVTLHIAKAKPEQLPSPLQEADEPYLAIHVVDTGIGIPKDKQDLIFEAFQQLDGTTSRNYGGAGLGLSISRELARLLGGKLQLVSREKEGSTFTFFLPMKAVEPSSIPVNSTVALYEKAIAEAQAALTVEGEEGHTSEERSKLVKPHLPQVSANHEGMPLTAWEEALLKEVAVSEEVDGHKWPFGEKKLLIVEDDGPQRQSLIALIEGADVAVTAVSTGTEALKVLGEEKFDGMVLDLLLPDMTGFELMDEISHHSRIRRIPIIVYTGKLLDSKEETELKKRAQSIIIKDVKSPERLLQETMILLKRSEEVQLSDEKENQGPSDMLLSGKRVLLVDDDVRNVFALSSVLEQYDMNIVYAENGREALEALDGEENFDLVLMDMMMPEMDGYEAMRRIREQPRFEKLPIIALTAKAMKEDRNKCIEAGASDYVSKPFQTEQLLSLMRVWLYK
ncbi:response regulator [Paenibacillus sp. chi10]|uniref:Circadian input-output histidine kinase CikA n=1 Tax=Paenibacillus suaedae TaxID=3077233 RepID=A0AAJ2JYX4_9BACL|nr:response regulator [Paenibacillus sp. chi10]MDT8979428.1 response regulator [Paenibacillus sp. chi10]